MLAELAMLVWHLDKTSARLVVAAIDPIVMHRWCLDFWAWPEDAPYDWVGILIVPEERNFLSGQHFWLQPSARRPVALGLVRSIVFPFFPSVPLVGEPIGFLTA